MKVVLRITGWMAASALLHFISAQTPMGLVRIEIGFFLAYYCALDDTRRFSAALSFLLPSLLFDLLDHEYAGTVSHLAVFFLARRLKGVIDMSRFPASAICAFILAAADRLVFGALAGYRLGAGGDMMLTSMMDPAIFLTALVLPFGLIGLKGSTQAD